MKRKVTITTEIDTEEYLKVEDSSAGVFKIIERIINLEADWSNPLIVECEDLKETLIKP